MKRILLLEDDEAIALGIRKFLAKNEYEVTCVNSITLAKTTLLNEPSYELILLDLNLPDGSGYSFCEYVKTRQDTPIIFITICDEDGEVIKGLELGADGNFVNDNTLTVTMKRLREKLHHPSFIKTVRGIGYLVEEPHE